MEVNTIVEKGYNPVTLSITLQTRKELYLLKSLFNWGGAATRAVMERDSTVTIELEHMLTKLWDQLEEHA